MARVKALSNHYSVYTEENMNISVRRADVQAEIRSENLPNTSPDVDRYADPLG
jgi:hypothetical protein